MEERCSSLHRGRSSIRKELKKSRKVEVGPIDVHSPPHTTRNVISRWLRELRPGSREPKVHLPLGRTLSTNEKSKERKQKINRTLSASHRERKKVADLDDEGLEAGWYVAKNKYQTYNERFVREHTNSAPRIKEKRFPSICSEEHVKRIFHVDDPFDGQQVFYENTSGRSEWGHVSVSEHAVNRNARVSYLDEEGLKSDRHDTDNESTDREETPVQDDHIMPTSSLQPNLNNNGNNVSAKLMRNNTSQLPGHRSKESLSPTSADKFKITDYSRFEYVKYKHQEEASRHQPPSQHEYENLPSDSITNRSNFGQWAEEEDVPARDASSVKTVRYGPGHEKFPSWPGSVPGPVEKPARSHSWSQQTNYPKEQPASYARPVAKRQNPAFTQQLKTVMEKCEKISPESYQRTSETMDGRDSRRNLPRLDREGKCIGDQDYMVPSPPERDKPPLSQADFEKYYADFNINKMGHADYASPYEDIRPSLQLTQTDLEEYTRGYDESLKSLHQHQGSYAQSEGYHSYVSSSELTTTPFLDRLRQESEGRPQLWDDEQRPGRDSVVTTSSGSVSSSETLKCHGSMSDVSVTSSSSKSKQLIAHSSRVAPPKRHHSESVLYLGGQTSPPATNDRAQLLKLFPVNTYTVQPSEYPKPPVISPTSQPQLSVAERISELEKQQQQQRYIYLDPEKRCRVSDPTLKAIQKKALLSFYERHQHSSAPGLPSAKSKDAWKSEPQLSVKDEPVKASNVPLPPPRPMQSSRRASSGEQSLALSKKSSHQHFSSMGSLHSNAVFIGTPISIDDWVPERPPKKAHLRPMPTPSPVEVPVAPEADAERPSTPDLPPPPPPPSLPEDDVSDEADEPLPPPPEAEWLLATAVPRRSTPGPVSPPLTNLTDSHISQSSIEDPPLSLVQGTFGTGKENDVVLGHIVKPSEIQYDPDAINAILESNRGVTEQLKRRGRKQKEEPAKSHIENRPPLPLPRDAQPPTASENKQGCELDDFAWLAQFEKARKQKKTLAQALESAPSNPFLRSGKDTSVRSSIKMLKNEMVARMSLRFPGRDRPSADSRTLQRGLSATEPTPPVGPTLLRASSTETDRPRNVFPVKKVSEYEMKVPMRDREFGLSVFPRRMSEELSPEENGPSEQWSTSKAHYLAVRREKELGINNYEGSYKRTMSSSGETIEQRSPTDPTRPPLEIVRINEKSNENIVLDNRLPLEPPDLIPKMPALNQKSTSVQNVYEIAKDVDTGRVSYERYRHHHSFNIRSGAGRVAYRNDIRSIAENEGDSEYSRVTSTKSETDLRERLSEPLPKEPVHHSLGSGATTPVPCVATDTEDMSKEPLKECNLNYASSESAPENTDTSSPPVLENMSRPPDCAVERSRSLIENSSSFKRKETLNGIERSTSLGSEDLSVPDVTKTQQRVRKLIERSTSFGRSDSMLVLDTTPVIDISVTLSDAASQTDLTEDPDDLEVERLSRDLASQLSPSDKLQTLLVPAAERKKPTDYVAGLFNLDAIPRRRSHRKHKTGSICSTSSGSSTSSATSTLSSSSADVSSKNDLVKMEPDSPLPSTSPYFTTSESKAKFLASFPNAVDNLSPFNDSAALQQKKEELMQRLDRKLSVLRAEQLSLTEECGLNDELGGAVAALVARVARPHEASKYRLHVEEVGKITSLLLGLSGRLARAENALLGLPENHGERKIHEDKRDKLKEQLQEAKALKESIDRRSESVCKTLGKYLSEEDLADYLHFIHMKEKLIVDAREIADKIALGEEQLAALQEPHGTWP